MVDDKNHTHMLCAIFNPTASQLAASQHHRQGRFPQHPIFASQPTCMETARRSPTVFCREIFESSPHRRMTPLTKLRTSRQATCTPWLQFAFRTARMCVRPPALHSFMSNLFRGSPSLAPSLTIWATSFVCPFLETSLNEGEPF